MDREERQMLESLALAAALVVLAGVVDTVLRSARRDQSDA